MVEVQLPTQLPKKEESRIMLDFEHEPVTPADDPELEDVTELIFEAAEELADLKFLAKDDFDLFETMSAY